MAATGYSVLVKQKPVFGLYNALSFFAEPIKIFQQLHRTENELSNNSLVDQQMMEHKIKSTDWEATSEAIEEQVIVEHN